jgi:hypothetical protein
MGQAALRARAQATHHNRAQRLAGTLSSTTLAIDSEAPPSPKQASRRPARRN